MPRRLPSRSHASRLAGTTMPHPRLFERKNLRLAELRSATRQLDAESSMQVSRRLRRSWSRRQRIERTLTAAAASSSCCVHIWSLTPMASTWCSRRRECAQAGEDRSLHDYAHGESATRPERPPSMSSALCFSRDGSPASFREVMLHIGLMPPPARAERLQARRGVEREGRGRPNGTKVCMGVEFVLFL